MAELVVLIVASVLAVIFVVVGLARANSRRGSAQQPRVAADDGAAYLWPIAFGGSDACDGHNGGDASSGDCGGGGDAG